jgi:hypothetical protein
VKKRKKEKNISWVGWWVPIVPERGAPSSVFRRGHNPRCWCEAQWWALATRGCDGGENVTRASHVSGLQHVTGTFEGCAVARKSWMCTMGVPMGSSCGGNPTGGSRKGVTNDYVNVGAAGSTAA